MAALTDTSPRLLISGASTSSGWTPWWPAVLTLGLFWLVALNQQRLEWVVNPVYSYGWAVPVLVIYLFWARWTSRPEAGRVLDGRWFAVGVIAMLAVCLPLRVVQEANPDWVKINWAQAGLWTGVVLLSLARVGGWPYAKHFFFPLIFAFTALPWPVWMEEGLTQTLMGWNAVVSAEVLTLMGTPALAVGNLIQVGENWVNVEEACSGIRSLQTAFMMSLFLGEFYRFNIARRLALLAASFAVAFLVNLVRTAVLTNLAEPAVIDEWHDTIGTVTMFVCLVALWLMAEGLNPSRRGRPAAPPRAMGPVPPPFGWKVAAAICAWLLLAEVTTAAWYHMHERRLPPPMAWDVQWPREAPGFVEGEFAERMTALLKFNDGMTAGWTTMGGHSWQMYYLQWEPGRVSKFLSSAHYPTVCLPATGLKLVSETGVWVCTVNGIGIPFTTYLFDEGGRDVYVFHAVLEDRPVTDGSELSYRQVTTADRFDSVWRGERNLGQRVVGIALRGPFTPDEARAEVTQTLAAVVHPAAEPAIVAHSFSP